MMVSLVRLVVFAAAFGILEKTRAALALQTSNCLAASEPGQANAAACTVNYMSSVNFTCPLGIRGEWRRWLSASNNSVLCNGDIGESCDYSGGGGKLYYGDEGLYFCESVSSDHYKLQYFVNLSVHAPPMLMNPPPLHIHYCDKEKHSCRTTDMMRYLNDVVTLSAVFHSPPDLPITLELYHNESRINCSALDYCTLHVNPAIVFITLDSNHFYHNRSDPGVYSFNISNGIGYNVSETKLDLRCRTTPNPIPLTENRTITVERNQPIDVSCKLAMETGYTMYMCLVNESETVNEHNFTKSCAMCSGQQCFSSLTDRPTWNFTERDDPSSPYCEQFTMTAHIPSISLSDNNKKMICAWGDDINLFMCKGCTSIHLKVTDPEGGVQPYVYAVACAGGVALICAVVTVGLVVVGVRRRRRNREGGYRVIGDGVRHKSRGRRRSSQQAKATKGSSDSDADDEHEPIRKSITIKSSYGATPRRQDEGGFQCGHETEGPLPEDEVPKLFHTGESKPI